MNVIDNPTEQQENYKIVGIKVVIDEENRWTDYYGVTENGPEVKIGGAYFQVLIDTKYFHGMTVREAISVFQSEIYQLQKH